MNGRLATTLVLFALLASCLTPPTDAGARYDAGAFGRTDAAVDATRDVAADIPADDASLDTGEDPGPSDSGVDVASDTDERDAADVPDAQLDGGTPPPAGPELTIWAPGAVEAHVFGEFNLWSRDSTPMATARDGSFRVSLPAGAWGSEYRVLLTLDDGTQLERVDPNALAFALPFGNSVLVPTTTPAPFTRPAVSDLVIYELHIGSFADTPADGPGTFLTAIDRLDHLVALGINAVELMPIAEFPGERSWGYNPWLPRAIESSYGGPSGLEAFIEAAHARGIAVIIDVVYNHLADESPLCDYDVVDGDGRCTGPWFYADDRGLTPWGPRPDYDRPEVRDWLVASALLWPSAWGADGLRWDSTGNIRATDNGYGPAIAAGEALIRQANAGLAERGAWSFAEDLAGDPRLTAPADEGGLAFDAQWDPRFHATLRGALLGEASLVDLAATIVNDGALRPRSRVIYAESHDTTGRLNADLRQPHNVRLPDDLSPADPAGLMASRGALLAAMITLCSPGVPMLLQGQELLSLGTFHDDVPVDWARAETLSDWLRAFTTLVRLRTGADGGGDALRMGTATLSHLNSVGGVLAWLRRADGDDALCVANVAGPTYPSYRLGVPAPGPWQVAFHSDSEQFGGGGVPGTVLAEDLPWDGWDWSVEISLGERAGAVITRAASE